MTNRLIIFGIIIFVTIQLRAIAQKQEELQFTHINTSNGLSSQYVRNIFEDSRGLIWICTTNGLNRYNGNTFKVYKSDLQHKNSLPDNDIWCMAEDAKHNFWIGTENGLCYFEPAENKFTNYLYEYNTKNTLAFTRVECIALDDSGFVWIGALNGIQKFNPNTKVFQNIPLAKKAELTKTVNAQAVYQLFFDNKKQLWACAGGHLFLINNHTLSYKKIEESDNINRGINNIYQDKQGQYWLCFWGFGIAKFDGIHFPQKNDYIKTDGIYFRINEWKNLQKQNLLVITKDDGLCFYNKENKKFTTITHDNDKPNSFASHESKILLNDRNNNLWISTLNGVDIVEPSKQIFQYHWLGNKQNREEPYKYGIVMPVYKDKSYYWASLWYAKGFVKLDSNFKNIKHFATIPSGSSNPYDKTVFGIYKDEQKILWLATESKLVAYTEANNKFESYVPTDCNPTAFEFSKILPYGNDKLFIRTRHLGIYIFDKKTKKFITHFTKENNTNFAGNEIRNIVYDKAGKLWVATSTGICNVDTATLVVNYSINASDEYNKMFANIACLSIEVDGNNNVWISNKNGLYKYESNTKSLTHFTTADGLCSNIITKIICDNNNNIWINTSDGLSVYLQKENKFQNFFKEDGLPQNSVDGTINKDENGRLYFGYAGVVLTVNPNDVIQNKAKSPVIITDASVANNFYPIQKNSNSEKYIEISYKQNSFTVDFAVLNYNSPKLNKYYYKLDGLEKNWNQSDRGIATYINVPPGHYTLMVKGSNNNGIINEEGDFIKITITPLWYQTNLFKALCILLLGALVYYFVQYRIAIIKKEAALRQKITETEMYALRSQMNPHFIFNSLNSIENFIMQNEKRLASDYLNKFARLIRMILDSSKNEMVPVAKDLEALQLYIDLEQLRFHNKFIYKTHIDAQLISGDYAVPSLLIQPYVENAIVHGLSHSEKNNLLLTITAVLENDTIKYSIQDNGVGRFAAAAYNRLNKPNHKSVGLQITTDRISNFNGANDSNAVKIIDLFDKDNNPCGTKVELQINVK